MLSALLFLISLVMFVLAAFGVDPDAFNLAYMAAAFLAAGLLVSHFPWGRNSV